MKFEEHKLALAAGITSAIIFTACSIIMYLWPQSLNMSAAMFHLTSFGPLNAFFDLNAQIFVSGLVQTSVYTYICIYLFAYIYNQMNKKR